MIQEKNIYNCSLLVAKYAMRDFRHANPPGKYKKHHPYILSTETMETRDMFTKARLCTSAEEEAEVKNYLLKKKMAGEFDDTLMKEIEGERQFKVWRERMKNNG